MDKFVKAAFIYASIVTIGGFVFGLDAAVISGTLRYVAAEFMLDDMQLGNVVSAPALGVLLALVITGAICEAIGRKKTLIMIAMLYVISAIASALAPSYEALVAARFLGGLAFTSLSLASMYIGEIAPAKQRGKLVSMNQIMIVIGLTAAYFSNYWLLQATEAGASWVQSWGIEENLWRWMLGMEILPALLWCILLFVIPESPRWLMSKGRVEEAKAALSKLTPADKIEEEISAIQHSLDNMKSETKTFKQQFSSLFDPRVRLAMIVGFVFAIVQPSTGVNPILFYAPMVFEQTGIGTNAAFAQTIIIGLVSFVFTALAIVLVDRLGRRPLVNGGLIASVLCLLLCVIAFKQAHYSLDEAAVSSLVAANSQLDVGMFESIVGQTFADDKSFKLALSETMGVDTVRALESQLIQAAVTINSMLVLVGIVGFIAAFHISIGPIMWVVFSEIVPTHIRGVAIPMFALVCSTISYFMQKFFPWLLNVFGAADVFLSYMVSGLVGLVLLWKYLPETKNKSIEEVEEMVVAYGDKSDRNKDLKLKTEQTKVG